MPSKSGLVIVPARQIGTEDSPQSLGFLQTLTLIAIRDFKSLFAASSYKQCRGREPWLAVRGDARGDS